MSDEVLVDSDEALADFRRRLSGSATLARLASAGAVAEDNTGVREFIQTPPGTGKSTSIDEVASQAITSGAYDLVIVLCPTRAVLGERQIVRSPPEGVVVRVLAPRPSAQCGPTVDRQWKDLERRGLGALGRSELCAACPHRAECPWPDQLGNALKGADIIVATSAYVHRDPYLLPRIKRWVGAERILVLVDEDDLATNSFRRRISREHLEQHVAVLDELARTARPRRRQGYQRHLETMRLLLDAGTEDLREGEWLLRSGARAWCEEVQATGLARFGSAYRFVAETLVQLGWSRPATRQRHANGDLSFAASPAVRDMDLIIYSGTASAPILSLRLGTSFTAPFAGWRFRHPGTRWYNLASSLASARNFYSNAPRLLDAFARLIAKRLGEGKRVAVVVKKRFCAFCVRQLQERLDQLGVTGAAVVSAGEYRSDATAHTVPVLTYGLIGCNDFAEIDCCYCLTSYNVSERVLDAVLQDLLADDFRIPLTITMSGQPRRRRATVTHAQDRFYDVAHLAQEALDQEESGAVLQAVGRVRPFTRPREIVTLQCAQLPGVAYTREFSCLAQLRHAFGLPTAQEATMRERAHAVQRHREAGKSQSQTATATGLSLRTVKRYWRKKPHD